MVQGCLDFSLGVQGSELIAHIYICILFRLGFRLFGVRVLVLGFVEATGIWFRATPGSLISLIECPLSRAFFFFFLLLLVFFFFLALPLLLPKQHHLPT